MWIQSNCSSALTLLPLKSVTESFAKVIHGLKVGHLTDRVIQRSKRMVLDALGVGLLGTSTEVFHKTSGYSKVRSSMSTLELKPGVHTHLFVRCIQGHAFVFYCSTLHFRESTCWIQHGGLQFYAFLCCICCCCSVTQSCPTLCDPVDCSTPGFLGLHCQSLFKLKSIESMMPSAISSSIAPFSPCPLSFPATGSLPMNQLFASGGPSTGASVSASVLPMNIQDWFPEWEGNKVH